MTTLVVAAAASETRYLPADVDMVLTGLGKTAAAIATTRALAERTPQERAGLQVVNLGSCGALRPGMRADFAVVDDDPWTSDAAGWADISVHATYIDGLPAYSA